MTTLLTILAMVAGPSASEAPTARAAGCLTRECDRRVIRKRKWRAVRPYDAKLERMAWCESTGRWHISGPRYHGGLQFDVPTWRSVGGTGMPHWHSELEQKFRAVVLIRRRGYAPWPICGAA
jgi:Transglycosylase-like domain